MKISKKALQLIDKGMTAKTVSKLTESQINTLHSKLFLSEQVQEMPSKKSYKVGQEGGNLPPAPKGYNVKKTPTGDVVATPNESELGEEEEVTVDPNKETETQDPHQVGPSSDDGFGNYGDGMDEGEMTEKNQKKNPWAICTTTMGKKFGTTERSDWSKRQMKEYERCVMDVKKQIKENKNPILPILENITRKQIETNLLPQMDKASLIEMITKNQSIVKRPLYNLLDNKTKKMDKPIGKMFSITKEELESDLKEMEKTEGKTRELSPNPGKTKIPDYLTFDQLNIKFKK